jgi:hypothetical protein
MVKISRRSTMTTLASLFCRDPARHAIDHDTARTIQYVSFPGPDYLPTPTRTVCTQP